MDSVAQANSSALESLDLGIVFISISQQESCHLQSINERACYYLGLDQSSVHLDKVLGVLYLGPSLLCLRVRELEQGASSFQILCETGRLLHISLYHQRAQQQVMILIAPATSGEEVYTSPMMRSHDLLFILDDTYHIKNVHSMKLAQHLKLPVDAVVGRLITHFFDEKTAQEIRISLERSRTTKSKQTLFYHSPLDSDTRSFKATVEWSNHEEDSYCYFAVDDVTVSSATLFPQSNTTSCGTLVVSEKGRIVFADSSSAQMLGIADTQLIGLDMKTLLPVTLENKECKVDYHDPIGEVHTFLVENTKFLSEGAHPHYALKISEHIKASDDGVKGFVNLLLNLTFRLLQTPVENSDEVISHILRELGEYSKSERAYIFLCNHQGDTISNSHEWCAPGILEQRAQLQDIPCNLFPQWMHTLRHGQEIYILSVANLPDTWKAEREILLPQGITSILIEPISASQQLLGFIGFDMVRTQREWPEDVRNLLHFFAQILGAFFARAHSQRRLKASLHRSSDLAREKDEINRYMQNFYAKISHDIHTSLNAIVGTSKLLEQSSPTADQQNYISMIKASSMFLTNLLNDILDFSLLSKKGFEIKQQRISIESVVRNSVEALRVLAMEKGLEVAVSFEEIIPGNLLGDSVRLTQILINLLHNAVKFSSRGPVQIKVSLLDLTARSAQLEFVIKDRGIGMDSQLVDRLFSNEGKTPAPSVGGYGLGLSIVKQLVDSMQGTISVMSEPGKGTTFILSLPFKLVDIFPAVARQHEQKPYPSVLYLGTPTAHMHDFMALLEEQNISFHCCTSITDLSDWQVQVVIIQEAMLQQHRSKEAFLQWLHTTQHTPRVFVYGQQFYRGNQGSFPHSFQVHGYLLEEHPVSLWYLEICKKLSTLEKPDSLLRLYAFSGVSALIVDDTSISAELLKYKLGILQVTVHTARSGEEAIEMAQRMSFHIIFMDLRLPGIDGMQAARQIQQLAKDGWVVVTSAFISIEKKERCKQAGICEFLRKPVEQAELIDVLTRYTTRPLT